MPRQQCAGFVEGVRGGKGPRYFFVGIGMQQGIAVKARHGTTEQHKRRRHAPFHCLRPLQQRAPHAEHQQCHALGRRHIHQRRAPHLAKHHPVQGAQAGGPVPAGGGAARLIEARKNRQIAGQMHGAQRRAVKGRQGAVGPGFRRQLCGNFCRFRGGVHG